MPSISEQALAKEGVMVDFLSSTSPKEACPGPGTTTPDATGTGTEGRHLRHLMGRTQGLLKSRLKSVLAGSNGLLTGLSTRLESALSLSTDTLSDSTDDDGITDDATTEATTDAATPTPTPAPTEPAVSRGASEIFRYKKLRLPRLKHALSFEDYTTLARHKKKKERAQAAVAEHAQPKGRDDQSLSSGDTTNDCGRELSPVQPQHIELQATGPDPYDKLHYKTEAPSSGSASDIDGYGPSTSIDTDQDGKKYWVRSGSEGSVQSWASSLSYESQSDEITVEAVEFMRKFVHDLFQDSSAIPLDQKSKFGQLAQHEAGRLWFSRFVNAQRVHHKKVDESTFYSLVQYFAIVLFECADADDFSPAKSLMNMCFTFYHEIDVPGCEPYKEYLYTYLREQTIWHSLRFWNAAFFDALQCERVHRPVVTRDDIQSNRLEAITDEKQYQENITFGQLGTFTYNMHAFGLSRELCSEFLRKQCIIANLSEEQEKMLRDNVERMYRETELWR